MISLPISRTELEFALYDKCKESPDLLKTIISEYLWSLNAAQLSELTDFLKDY